MAKAGQTFSESWHRVANIKTCFHPTVKIKKQYFRGEKWYVVYDQFQNNYFRLPVYAYEFVSRLNLNQTVEEVWDECIQKNAEEAPGQEDVVQLLSQLYLSNLLHFKNPADSTKLFERQRKKKQREFQSRALSIMFMRIPLIDPDRWLNSFRFLIRWLFSPIGGIIWLIVIGYALKQVVENFTLVTQQVDGVLAPNNLFLLYIALVFIKTLHELGHAMACKRYGGEVHTMGVMFLVFTPLPYMDASASWSFQNRWHRALVGAAGMIIELFVAGIATIVWAYTGKGALHSLAYNVMFIASVTTVLFNANPLLRLDGYYILSDLLDIPNLTVRSKQHIQHLVERYLFGYKDSESPTQSMKEKSWLTVYGILSNIYRIVVFVGIILFVADKFLLLGLLMAVVCLVSWLVVPVYRLINYLLTSPRLTRTRYRAIVTSSGILSIITLFLMSWPISNQFRAPGVLETKEYVRVINKTNGFLDKIYVPTGTYVKKGTELLGFINKELDYEINVAKAQLAETEALKLKARSGSIADLAPVESRFLNIKKRLDDLRLQKKDLIVRASQSGIWVAPTVEEFIGSWIKKGSYLGELVDTKVYRFSAVVSQNDASNLFQDQIQKAEVKLYGQEKHNISIKNIEIIPYTRDQLPSAALGWYGGGEVAVSDQSGRGTTEPFFQIYGDLETVAGIVYLHGRAGQIQFSLEKKPLLWQWARKTRQLLQKRYRI